MSDDGETTVECAYRYSDEDENSPLRGLDNNFDTPQFNEKRYSCEISEENIEPDSNNISKPNSSSARKGQNQKISSTTALVNAQPQDFVILRGLPYRVTRSPRLGKSSSESEQRPGSTDDVEARSLVCTDIQTLHRALEDAHDVIGRQRREIMKQARKIDELERLLSKYNVDCGK